MTSLVRNRYSLEQLRCNKFEIYTPYSQKYMMNRKKTTHLDNLGNEGIDTIQTIQILKTFLSNTIDV